MTLRKVSALFFALLSIPACHPAARSVPESWFRLPENGGREWEFEEGSERFGATVENVFAASSEALDALAAREAKAEPASKAIDWVPWRLAGVSMDFAVTVDGIFGAILGEGTAAVQAIWRHDDDASAAALSETFRSGGKPAIRIRGTATPAQVARALEPSIRAALSSGRFRDEGRLRRNVLAAAERFRAMSWRLERIHALQGAFAPTAFRLELGVNADGDVTPVAAVGAEVGLRLDWKYDPDDAWTARESDPGPVSGERLEAFVTAIAPDLDAAAGEARRIEAGGFALEAIRVAVGVDANGDFGIASGSVSAMGGIQFGSTAQDCYDPDGDGDCNGPRPSASELRLIEARPSAGVVYRIPHAKFRAGMKRAVRMGAFFARHAAKSRHGHWRIQELETELQVSLTGTVGLATVGGTGEVELEFINRKEL